MKSIKPNPFEDKIGLKTFNGIEIFCIADIIYCFIQNREVQLLLMSGQTIKLYHSLKELESFLTPFHFFRCHAKTLINAGHVSRYNHKTGCIRLDENIELQVAFHRRIQVKQMIMSTITPFSVRKLGNRDTSKWKIEEK